MASTTEGSVPSAAPKRISPHLTKVSAPSRKTAYIPWQIPRTVCSHPKRLAILCSLVMPLQSEAMQVSGPTTASIVSSACSSPVVLTESMTRSAGVASFARMLLSRQGLPLMVSRSCAWRETLIVHHVFDNTVSERFCHHASVEQTDSALADKSDFFNMHKIPSLDGMRQKRTRRAF